MPVNIVWIIIVVLAVLLLAGGLGPWSSGPYFGTGWAGGGVLGIVLIVLIVLLLMGRL